MPESPPGYNLIRRLGGGATGTVYLAREYAPERDVAMKLLNSPSNPAAFERFLVEARALARLDHPNIVKVYDVEINWREPFLTMEYANGGTLSDLVKPNFLPDPQDAARLMLAAAEAVAAAHAGGILHRDIKPSNILLHGSTASGSTLDAAPPTSPGLAGYIPKVSDFGLAKRTDRDDGLTRTGPLGTPAYMSPEAAAGRYRDVGPAADVYGLGATLYYLLIGDPPFTADTPEQIILKVINELPARPRAMRPDLPPKLEGIVVKAMEKNPADRYPTAAALANDLRLFLAGQGGDAPVLTPLRRARRWIVRKRRSLVGAAGLVVFAALLVAGAWHLLPPKPPVDPEQAIRDEIASGQQVRLLTPDGQPRVAHWPLGPAELSCSTDDGGTCGFESRDRCVLLLLRDPGVDSYRVRVQIWQKQKLGHVDPRSNSKLNTVGLVLGYDEQDGPNNIRAQCMTVLAFSEYEPKEEAKVIRELKLLHEGLLRTAGPTELVPQPSYRRQGVLGVPLKRFDEEDTARWREFVAEVSPAGVTLPTADGPRSIDAVSINDRRRSLRDNLNKSLLGPVPPFPDWKPRLPLGIWAHGSRVHVKNFSVESLK